MHATVDSPWTGVRLALLLILLLCFILFFVSWPFLVCFVFPSLEFSLAGYRSVNLTLPFLNCENGDFLVRMRDIFGCALNPRSLLWVFLWTNCMSTEQDVSQWHKQNGSFVAIWFILLWVFLWTKGCKRTLQLIKDSNLNWSQILCTKP